MYKALEPKNSDGTNQSPLLREKCNPERERVKKNPEVVRSMPETVFIWVAPVYSGPKFRSKFQIPKSNSMGHSRAREDGGRDMGR